jgi:lipoate-protein ligase A
MNLDCIVLPFSSGDGPGNMAMDEALLEQAAEGEKRASLRTYIWSEPTLSLGYFQRLAEKEAEARWQGVPVVRRATGGGAIWHHHELTYALVLPSQHPRARPHSRLYHAVHMAIAEALRLKGVTATRRGGPEPSASRERTARRPFLCFADRDPEDLVCGDFKVVGSAQRRRVGAILQHGSVLLRRSPVTPELAGICDLFKAEEAPHAWIESIVASILAALGLTPLAGETAEPVRRRALELTASVYRNAAWTGRR